MAGFEVPSRDDEQTDLLRQADRVLPAGEEGLRAAVRARLSLALAGSVPDADRVGLAEGAVAAARRAGAPEIECAALAAYCDAIAGPDHVAERAAAATRMIELAGDTGILGTRRPSCSPTGCCWSPGSSRATSQPPRRRRWPTSGWRTG